MKLSAIASKSDTYGLVALDQLPQLAEQLKVDVASDTSSPVLQQLSTALMKILSPESTGVIVSARHSFHTIIHKSHNAGLLLSLEEHGSSLDPLRVPQLAENWGPEYVKNNYGVCKLELYYHPKEDNALKKKQLAAEIHDYCQYLGIDFLLELNIYTQSTEDAKQHQESKLWAIEEFRTLCDAMALEPPQDPLAMVTVTAELDIPWLYKRFQVDYETFKTGLRSAVESGASGFIVGHSLWADMPIPEQPEPKQEEIAETAVSEQIEDAVDFIRTTARDRVIELMRITTEETDSTEQT